jgi:hypothetical protein
MFELTVERASEALASGFSRFIDEIASRDAETSVIPAVNLVPIGKTKNMTDSKRIIIRQEKRNFADFNPPFLEIKK